MPISRRQFIRAAASAAALAAAGTPGRALAGKPLDYERSVCALCGVGCTVLVGSKGNDVVEVRGDAKSPINHGRICVKGLALSSVLYGRDRLKSPLLRQPDGGLAPIGWNEALGLLATTFSSLIKKHGPESVAWYGSGQNTTQDAYAASKLFKGIIGTPNVGSSAALGVSSAVEGYQNSFGSDETAGSMDDIDKADCIFIVGANVAETYPMLFRRVVNRKTAFPDRVRVIVLDPCLTATARFADLHLRVKPGYDMHLLNSMAHVMAREGLLDGRSTGHCEFMAGLGPKGARLDIEAYTKFLDAYAPERVAMETGLASEDILRAARWFGRRGMSALSLSGAGINQRTDGVELNCLVHNLHLLTGRIGTPGSGSMALSGQVNTAGALREQGGFTHCLPGMRRLDNEAHRQEIADIWGVRPEWLPMASPSSARIFDGLAEGRIKAIWINSANPAQSLPAAGVYAEAMRGAFTVVSDAYPTHTTQLATLVLPATIWGEKEGVMVQTDRRAQFSPMVIHGPEGAASDFWQIVEAAKLMGKKLGRKSTYRVIDPATGVARRIRHDYGLGFETEREAWDEYRLCTKGTDVDLWGATYEKLHAHSGGVQWPCTSIDHDNRGSAKRYISRARAVALYGTDKVELPTGYATLYDQRMMDASMAGEVSYYGGGPAKGGAGNKAVIRALAARTDAGVTDAEYPFVLITGRWLEQFNTGTFTMRLAMLREMKPAAYAEICPEDAIALGIANSAKVRISTAAGSMTLPALVTERPQRGTVFVPWFDSVNPVNRIMPDSQESVSGAPSFKLCPAKISKA